MSKQKDPYELINESWLSWDDDVLMPDGHSVINADWFIQKGVPKELCNEISSSQKEWEKLGAIFDEGTEAGQRFIRYFDFISMVHSALNEFGANLDGSGRNGFGSMARDYHKQIMKYRKTLLKS
jgi:hypothetical protein